MRGRRSRTIMTKDSFFKVWIKPSPEFNDTITAKNVVEAKKAFKKKLEDAGWQVTWTDIQARKRKTTKMSRRKDLISQMLCPDCENTLYWDTTGYDNFGKIQELACSSCSWSEANERERLTPLLKELRDGNPDYDWMFKFLVLGTSSALSKALKLDDRVTELTDKLNSGELNAEDIVNICLSVKENIVSNFNYEMDVYLAACAVALSNFKDKGKSESAITEMVTNLACSETIHFYNVCKYLADHWNDQEESKINRTDGEQTG